MNCPSCKKKFETIIIDDHYNQKIEIDMCMSCQYFWFDHLEEVRMHKKWIKLILQKIANHSSENKHLSSDFLCPHCNNILKKTQDITFSGEPIEKYECKNHGTLLSFDDFFRLKNLYSGFRVTNDKKPFFVHCKNCGNIIDPTSRDNCQYCNTPFSFFDADILQQILGENNSSKNSVGTHYLANFNECDISLLAHNKEDFAKKMQEISRKIEDEELTVLNQDFHFFGKNAVTGFFLLAESHIAFHTWPEKNFVSCDVFVCHHTKDNESQAENILEFLEKEIFQSRNSEIKKIVR